MSKFTIVAGLALLAASVGTAAEARGGHRHHHHHRHLFIYSAPVYVAPAYHDCSYSYARWRHTGSFHWKKRYYACKGWW